MEFILNITITSSVTAAVILLIKGIFGNRISPKWHYYIWAVLAVRLLIPALPESRASLFNSVPAVQNMEVTQRAQESIPPRTVSYVEGEVTLSERDHPFTVPKSFTDYVFMIWALGMAAMSLYMAGVYLIFHRKTKSFPRSFDPEVLSVLEECKAMTGVTRNIAVRTGGSTPLLKGLFRPEIILPEGYSKEELKGVFLHELMHLAHYDLPASILCTALLCVYWYNPLMWVCFFAVRRDMEILCDHRVLALLSDKKGYASILLKTALRKNHFIFATTSLQNGEKQIGRRIRFMATFQKPKIFWSAAAGLAAVAIGILCLTNGVGKTSEETGGYSAETLYKYKTEYVGDASKVGTLTSRLPLNQYRNGISLQTKSEPYGLTVNYEIESGDFPRLLTDEGATLLKNAAVIYCLIGNVEDIRFRFYDETTLHTLSFTREGLNGALKTDLREYASSFSRFKNELLPLLENFGRKDVERYASLSSVSREVSLYVWRDRDVTGSDDIYYTLFDGPDTAVTGDMIYDPSAATSDLSLINEKLKAYEGYTSLSIRHDGSFTKEEMLALSERIEFPGMSTGIGGFNPEGESDTAQKVEENLAAIMSSPAASSAVRPYIDAHPEKYEDIVKMGDDALNYMLSLFEKNEAQGLKAHIMMALCQDILGARNNVPEGTYSSPVEWYRKFKPYAFVKLTPFIPDTEDETERLVYEAALRKYQRDGVSVTVVAPHVFGVYEDGDIFKIFATVYYSGYNLYGTALSQAGAGVVPAAIVYRKGGDGSYTLTDYVEAQDGSRFQPSIEEFCGDRQDIARAIISNDGDFDLKELMTDNVTACLKQNRLTGISMEERNGAVTPLT